MPATKDNFHVKRFLANIGEGRKIVRVRWKQKVFVQGDPCDAVFYIQTGKIKLSVVSKAGKEATIAILNATDFFGEGCLVGQPLRMGTAISIAGNVSATATVLAVTVETKPRRSEARGFPLSKKPI
jgi:CRP/FNR family transcriptional regulator, cyclic AMP receptor protein